MIGGKYTQLKRELFCFVIIGLCATGLDFVIYWFLCQQIPFSVAKIISFCTGSCFVYCSNKWITFQKKQYSTQEIFRFIQLYAGTLTANVFVNSGSLFVCQHFFPEVWNHFFHVSILLAYVIATGVSTVLNFTGQKFFVFIPSRRAEEGGA